MRNKKPIHSRACVNAVRLNWIPMIVWALFLGFASLLGGDRETLYGGTGGAAGDPGVTASEFTEFRLETRDALRGDIVNVGVFVVVKSPLSEVSIAINFDEEDLRFLGVSQPTAVDNGQNNVTQSIDFDNNNDRPGNQAGEGWVHLQLKTANHQ
ncbi:MAG: hypothetical protein MK538_13120, partial [Planctomycetes bacterium]|nr:hypothetical protein [Planctomycetota bacterium]